MNEWSLCTNNIIEINIYVTASSWGGQRNVGFSENFAYALNEWSLKKYKYFTIVAGCGGIINADEGNITSPNYPNKYDQNLDCEWRIITRPGSRVLVYIDELDIVDRLRYSSSNQSQVFYQKFRKIHRPAYFPWQPFATLLIGIFRRNLRSFSGQTFCDDCIRRYKYMRRFGRFGTIWTI